MASSRFLLLCACCAALACVETDRSPVAGRHSVSDSSGVQIAHNDGPQWSAGKGWTIDSTPVLSIGEGSDSSQQFSRLIGHVRFPDNTIVIVDGPTNKLRYYDQQGNLRRRSGRKGSRVGSTPTVVGPSNDCFKALVREAHPLPSAARDGRHQNDLLWRSLDGSVSEAVLSYPGIDTRTVVYNGAALRQAVVWSNQPEFDANIHRLVLGMGNSAEYRVFDLVGKLRRITRWKADVVPVTEHDRDEYNAKRSDYIRRNQADENFIPPLELLTTAKVKPFYTDVIIDDANNVWLCRYSNSAIDALFDSKPLERSVTWMVFDSTGKMLGEVAVPSALTIQHIGTGEIAGVWRGPNDVSSLRIYHITKGP